MPWEDGSLGERSIFRRFATQFGSAFTLKVWDDLQELHRSPPPESDADVQPYLEKFNAALIARDGQDYATVFWLAVRSIRRQAWGIRKELEP
jgi:hypothetical protein